MPLPFQVPPRSQGLAVVSGAASGIGRATALSFARDGAALALLDIDGEGLAETAAQAQALGADVQAFQGDVTDPALLEAVARQLATRPGNCDVLVNNAGVLLRGRLGDENALEVWRRTLDVNLTAAFALTRALVPLLAASRGCIVNVASIHAQVAVPNSAAYTASKGGLKQLTQALALELAPQGIRVNAVAPGSIVTPMTAATRADPAAQARFLERVPLRRSGDPEEVVHAIRFLASDLASYITGATLPVDGGYLAG